MCLSVFNHYNTIQTFLFQVNSLYRNKNNVVHTGVHKKIIHQEGSIGGEIRMRAVRPWGWTALQFFEIYENTARTRRKKREARWVTRDPNQHRWLQRILIPLKLTSWSSYSKRRGTKAFGRFSGEFWNMSATKFILSAAKNQTWSSISPGVEVITRESLTLKERLEMFLRFEYPGIWFTSLDVKIIMKRLWKDQPEHSIHIPGKNAQGQAYWSRKGNHNQREYRFIEEEKKLMDLGMLQ